MAVVLLKIFEEANLSGELKLSGRKLKDFPKASGKYNLSDTVIADLSRNRFCELPDDVTNFPFLETLLMYHNTLRTLPETIRGLHSLSFLDLRSNLLTVLPRELCFLPIQVLLVSNNRLVSLPEELGRMEQLTELDAACNQIAHLPARMSDLKNLKSLSLRNNHLVYLPRDVTCLNLVSLDISCNKIASLPVELRLMTNLVSLEVDSNPLTSPPASLCVRGLVHIYKYLDTMAIKEEKSRTGGTFDGNTTLRRTATPKHSVIDVQKSRRHNVDSGYSTSDGYDTRWTQDVALNGSTSNTDGASKWSPTLQHVKPTVLSTDKNSPVIGNYPPIQAPNGTSTPTVSSTGNGSSSTYNCDEFKQSSNDSTPKRCVISNGNTNNNNVQTSINGSPNGDFARDIQKSDDKIRTLGNIQTYREYKEALRQQRNLDSSAVYRPKDQQAITPTDGASTPTESPLSTISSSYKSNTPSPTIYSSSNQNSPISPIHSNTTKKYPVTNHNSTNIASQVTASSPLNNHNNSNNSQTNNSVNSIYSNSSVDTVINNSTIHNGSGTISPSRIEKPVQKVTPSRNTSAMKYQQQTLSPANGSPQLITDVKSTLGGYVKPNSPLKASLSSPLSPNGTASNASAAKSNGSTKVGQKVTRNVSWNRDIPSEKLSFTMRREFDRQKEESELIEQLKKIIETRLKMTLPKDVASALTDGVVLCHLANHVRPRSVASIHVPSPAVPKLTMARCRRNVDNFLDACRKIGVDENLMCCAADVLEGKGAVQVSITVSELLRFHTPQNGKSSVKTLPQVKTISTPSPTKANSTILTTQ